MPAPRRGGGPALPYRVLASVVPTRAGWVVVAGRLAGVQLMPVAAELLPDFRDVLDLRPAPEVVVITVPIGLPAADSGGRACDQQARRLLGFPWSGAVASPPSYQQLEQYRAGQTPALGAVVAGQLARIVEVYAELGSYHQRTLAEHHPELSFRQLNDGVTVTSSRRDPAGIAEREALLRHRLPGIDDVLDACPDGVSRSRLLDAAVGLWTARRVAARAATRLPESPEWDASGLRMELVY